MCFHFHDPWKDSSEAELFRVAGKDTRHEGRGQAIVDLAANPPSKETGGGFVRRRLRADQRFHYGAADTTHADRSQGSGPELLMDHDVARRARIGLKEFLI